MFIFQTLILSLATLFVSIAKPINSNLEKPIIPSVDIPSILWIHNLYRARHNSPPVNWSSELATTASEWASRCVFEHSQNEFGENMAGRTQDWFHTITLWYNEEPYYNYDRPGFSEQSGHFTQVVWKNTNQIGCGVSYCDSIEGNFYVCSYEPSGNVIYGGFDEALFFRTNVTQAII